MARGGTCPGCAQPNNADRRGHKSLGDPEQRCDVAHRHHWRHRRLRDATSITANGTPNQNGNFVRIALHKGGFEVNSTALNAKADKTEPSVNATTCSGALSVTDPATLLDGTRLYKGITGTVSITETFALVLPRHASGPDKGQCNEAGSAQPLASYGSLVGTGTVHFS